MGCFARSSTTSKIAAGVPYVYVGSAFSMDQMTDASKYNFVRSNAGFHNHPVGWGPLTTVQRRQVLEAFTTNRATLESDICCAAHEISISDEMRQLKPGLTLDWFTNNIDKKVYVNDWNSPVTERGVTYNNSRTMLSTYNTEAEKHNVEMVVIWTVWNTVSPTDPVMNAWLNNYTYWEDTVQRSFGLVHDWPGSFIDWPHANKAWIERWAFYKNVYNITKTKYPTKKIMHYFTISTEQEWNQTQRQVREIEDHNVIPDVWIIGDFAGNYTLVPESINNQPAFTLTGFAYWLLKHIKGREKLTSLDLFVRVPTGEEYGVGTKKDLDETEKVEVFMRGSVVAVEVGIKNNDHFDFIPTVRTHGGQGNVRYMVRGVDVTREISQPDGYTFRGDLRLWPKRVNEFQLICEKNDGGCSVNLTVHCHPQAHLVDDIQDSLVIHFVPFKSLFERPILH